MSNNYFRFKQFIIEQGACGMKVGTDGVLLGAWCNVTDKKKILDIGTGTGLIALMVAQRNPNAIIDCIEIEPEACTQAARNFCKSPWANRLNLIENDFITFAKDNEHRYELIVSNPPFFENSIKPTCDQRTKARHTDSLPFEELITSAASLLSPHGILAMVYPIEAHDKIVILAKAQGLSCLRQTSVRGNAQALIKRMLVEFSFTNNSDETYDSLNEELVIERERHQYTDEYIALTHKFYLKMPD